MPILRVAGILLVLLLVGWVAVELIAPIGHHPAPNVLGLGSAFEGSLQLPAETITKAFDAARQRMIEVNGWGTRFRWAGDIAAWLSFAATASITLIVGFYGRLSAQGSAPDTSGLPARGVRLIGFLAALAAVLTGLGNLATAKSQEYYRHADELRDLIVHDRAQVIDAKTADAAQAILDDLINKTSR